MWRLSRPPQDDRGAVAIIVAMLFGFGVMIGAAALTIDVGRINLDRRQLQNGADAAALSAAADCVLGTCPNKDVTADMDRLRALADGNAGADQASAVARVDGKFALCGTPSVNGVATGLTDCQQPPDTSNLQECPTPKLPSAATPYVRVFTQSLNAAKNKTLLPYTVGAAIAGPGSGANQQACASVAWGQASITASVPLTLSACEWDRATTTGTKYAPQPSGASPFYGGFGQAPWPNAARTPPLSTLPTPYPANGQEVVIYLQSHAPNGYDSSCYVGSSNGHDAPGSFGWVDSATCTATISTDNWVKTDTGGDTPNPCKSVVDTSWKTVIFLPVFDCTTLGPQTGPVPNPLPTPTWCETGNGSNTYYHVKGWARFYLSGFHLPSADKVSPASNSVPCSGGDRCISGWFLQGLVDAPITITTPDSNFGVKGLMPVG